MSMQSAHDDKHSYKNLCGSCKSKPCCSDLFAPPILFEEDLRKLDTIGKANSNFVNESIIKNKTFKTIKKKENSNACIFFDEKSNVCSIYEHRPHDCRRFPFDIEWVEGEFRWIVYSCNPMSDWSWTEEHLKKLESEPQFNEMMRFADYFRMTSNDYVDSEKEPAYSILRKVDWQKI